MYVKDLPGLETCQSMFVDDDEIMREVRCVQNYDELQSDLHKLQL